MKNLNCYIDHTNLKADATTNDIEKLCLQAIDKKFASVCIHPYYIGFAKSVLKDSGVKICSVIGFPLGQNSLAVKIFEAKESVRAGATELDMVINIAALKEGNISYVATEIQSIVDAVSPIGVKVIVETCYLTEAEKKAVAEIILQAGAKFIKTSTGLGSGGATVEDIKLFKTIVGNRIGIKASGGIKTRESCLAMIKAGATRVGTSSGISILGEKS